MTHECDGPGCRVRANHQSPRIAPSEIPLMAFEGEFECVRGGRLAFLEERIGELRDMLRHRSRELIKARDRIAHLERCLGRAYARLSKEGHGPEVE